MAFETVQGQLHPLPFRAGRFVLFDSRAKDAESLDGLLTADHVTIDVDDLRRGEPVDPFAALVDQQTARVSWTDGPHTVSEQVARFPKAWIRRRLIRRLRELVTAADGLWVRLAPFPYPYRSAFSFRADLDESVPEDYPTRFAAARAPWRALLHSFRQHARLYPSRSRPGRFERPRHAISRSLPSCVPRSRSQSRERGAIASDPPQLRV